LFSKRQNGFEIAKCCPQTHGLGPEWRFLCPNAKILSANPNLLTRTAVWNQKSQIGDKNPRLGRRTADCAHKIANGDKKFPIPIKSWDWEQFPSAARSISQIGLKKPKAVEHHGRSRKSLAAGRKK